MIEKFFPDNHSEMFYSEEEFEYRLKEWLEKNPGWVKTHYGTWTNEIENKKFLKKLEVEREVSKCSN